MKCSCMSCILSLLTCTLLRSNRRDASKLISLRLTRHAKIAEHLGLEAVVAGDAMVAAAGGIMQHGRGHTVSVVTLLVDVLPNGAQWRGSYMLWCCVVCFESFAVLLCVTLCLCVRYAMWACVCV